MALFDKTGLLVIGIILVLVTVLSVVLAYSTSYNPLSQSVPPSSGLSTGPPVFGHSADEINVYAGGQIKTLQQAINEDYVPGSFHFTASSTGYIACASGEVVVSEITISQPSPDPPIYLRQCAKLNS